MRSRAARGLRVGWFMALLLGAVGGALAQGTPAWALGEQPNFAGTIPNWSDGDALAPGTGGIYAMAEIGAAYEEVEVGFGSIDASGTFRSPPTSRSLVEQYGFVYATTDGTVRGTCSGEGLAVSFDLDLRRGWNSLYMGAGLHIVTAAIPPDAAWYLVNAVVLAR